MLGSETIRLTTEKQMGVFFEQEKVYVMNGTSFTFSGEEGNQLPRRRKDSEVKDVVWGSDSRM